jgi:hypothetical protein
MTVKEYATVEVDKMLKREPLCFIEKNYDDKKPELVELAVKVIVNNSLIRDDMWRLFRPYPEGIKKNQFRKELLYSWRTAIERAKRAYQFELGKKMYAELDVENFSE